MERSDVNFIIGLLAWIAADVSVLAHGWPAAHWSLTVFGLAMFVMGSIAAIVEAFRS